MSVCSWMQASGYVQPKESPNEEDFSTVKLISSGAYG